MKCIKNINVQACSNIQLVTLEKLNNLGKYLFRANDVKINKILDQSV